MSMNKAKTKRQSEETDQARLSKDTVIRTEKEIDGRNNDGQGEEEEGSITFAVELAAESEVQMTLLRGKVGG